MASEIQERAAFDRIRYAQCWEDPALLVEALRPAGRHLLSIGSAGDNAFALLAAGAKRVTAVEMSGAQVACIEFRRAAYLCLDYDDFLALLGVRDSAQRLDLFACCAERMTPAARDFWQRQLPLVQAGVIHAGKFESYFRRFRSWALPLAHRRRRVEALFQPREREEREAFYQTQWNNRRWRWIFHLFFSRRIMGWLGRDPAFFDYVEGSVAKHILRRTRHAMVELAPAENPWMHFIMRGEFGEALPPALEEQNFAAIRQALEEDRLAVVEASLETHLQCGEIYDGFNLSDIFEYMSAENTEALMAQLGASASPGARLAYWNMLVPRSHPPSLATMWQTVEQDFLAQDRCFFYSAFVVEERLG